MSSVKSIVGGALFTVASALAPTSCSIYNEDVHNARNSRDSLLTEIMLDRPQTELDNIRNSFSQDVSLQGPQAQRAADSVLFRRMYESEQLLKDSGFVSNYNKMMANTTIPTTRNADQMDVIAQENNIKRMVTVRDMETIKKGSLFNSGGKRYTALVYLADSIANHRLMEENNLLTPKMIEKFGQTCKKLRP